MKRRYEGVYVIKLQGQEDGIDEVVSSITKELEAHGATLDQIDRLGRREFAHENHAKQKHGYFVQFLFGADPNSLKEVENRLKLNDQVMLQHYRRL